jgi:hypothetical protein
VRVPGWRTTNNCATSKRASEGSYQPNDPALSATNPTRQRGGNWFGRDGRSAPSFTRSDIGTTRSARVSRPRRLARPTGLPRSSQTQVSEVFVLAKLTPNEGDLSVKHLGGVRRPAPSAGSCLGRGQETRAQRGRVPGWRTTNNCATSKRASDGPYQPNDPAPSATNPTRQRGGNWFGRRGRSAPSLTRSGIGTPAPSLARRVGMGTTARMGAICRHSIALPEHRSLKPETCQETLSEFPVAPIILPTRCNCLHYNNKGRIYSISMHCIDCRADTL